MSVCVVFIEAFDVQHGMSPDRTSGQDLLTSSRKDGEILAVCLSLNNNASRYNPIFCVSNLFLTSAPRLLLGVFFISSFKYVYESLTV